MYNQPMRRSGIPVLAVIAWVFFAFPASAHPLDIAYLDIGRSSSGALTLTVALHPYQAFELVRAGRSVRFDLESLRQNGDLVSAYAEEHVSVTSDGLPCSWSPGPALTPGNELEAVADGVTIAGPLDCPSEDRVTIGSTIFLDGFPKQTSVIRRETPDGYQEIATLNRDRRSAAVDVSSLAPSGPMSRTASRTPDGDLLSKVGRLLGPGVGVWGLMGLLLSVAFLGALHALGPGHGKSLMAAVLVGERATAGRMVLLGTVMTMTHVADVFLLSLLAGLVSAVLPPSELLRALSFVSALGLVILGLLNLWRAVVRYRLVRNNSETAEADEAHARAHELGLPHAHEPHAEHVAHRHAAPDASFRRALWTGFVGSLAPCPTAWAIFLATLSLGRPWSGLLLLVAFTIGLHLTILAIGSLLLASKTYVLRRTSPRFTYALPILSAVVLIGLGLSFLARLA